MKPSKLDVTQHVPNAPKAPEAFTTESSLAWQQGWTTGYGAALFQLKGVCVPQVSFDDYFKNSSGFDLWPHPDRVTAKRAARATWEFLTQGEQAQPVWADEHHSVKTWIERAKEADDWPMFSGDVSAKYMDLEIRDLRVYIQGLHAGAKFLNQLVDDLRKERNELQSVRVNDLLSKPVAYRYSVSGMYEYATRREDAVRERKSYEDSMQNDPDFEHEEPEALYTHEQVMALLAAQKRELAMNGPSTQ